MSRASLAPDSPYRGDAQGLATTKPVGNQTGFGSSGSYALAKRRVDDTYGFNKLGNDYARQVSTRNYGQAAAQAGRAWTEKQNNSGWGAAAKGMIRSGGYRHNYGQMQQDHAFQQQQMNQQYADQQWQYSQNQMDEERQKAFGYEQADVNEGERLAQLAALLREANY